MEQLKGSAGIPVHIEITIGDKPFTGHVKYSEEAGEALAFLGIGDDVARWTERNHRCHRFKANNYGEARQEGLKFMIGMMPELIEAWDPELDNVEPEKPDDQEQYMFELDQKILEMKSEIIDVVRELRQDMSYKTILSAISHLYALASNADGMVYRLEGNGEGYIDASLEEGVQLRSDH